MYGSHTEPFDADIIKLKENEYKWIGELYKKGKHMIRFITNHSNARGIKDSKD